MTGARALLVGIAALLLVPGVSAQQLDELLEGFDNMAHETPAVTAASSDDHGTDFSGSVVLGSSYNYLDHETANGTQWHGLSKLRTRLNLQLDQKLSDAWQARVAGYGFYDWAYWIRDRDRFSDDVLDEYEHEGDWQEVWLRGKLRSDLDLKVGRQVVNWGRADSLRVLDVLNPLDNREPGMADIEDVRLPVGMVKLDWFASKTWQASFIAIPEMRFSKNPVVGSDFGVAFSPLFGSQMALLDEQTPEHFSDTAFATSLTGTFSGWDVSFHAGHFWRDTPYLHVAGPYNLARPVTALQQLDYRHSDYDMAGVAANLIQGSWLFKGEFAWFDGFDYTTTSPMAVPRLGLMPLPAANVQKDRADLLLGVEYFGFANTALALEVVNRHIVGFETSMEPMYERRDRMEAALRYTGNFINDRLEITALGIAFGERAQEGSLLRLQGAYDIRDALVLTVGVIDYCHGDLPPFDIAEHNDRVFAELKYSF